MATQRDTETLSTSPRPTVAVVGGGQLARMLHEAASELSVNLKVLVESSQGSAALANPHILVGLPNDPKAVEDLIEGADVVTFEHEHIPQEFISFIEGKVEAQPHFPALFYAQDKLLMRERLRALNISCPQWMRINDVGDLLKCGKELGYPFIVKAPRGGYDGHGVLIIRSEEHALAAAHPKPALEEAQEILGGGTSAKGADPSIVLRWLEKGPILAEEMVSFYDELSIQVARRPSGETKTWEVVRSEQTDGVCSIVTAPAPDLSEKDAQHAKDMACRIAQSLDVTGVLAVELFRVRHSEEDGSTHDELLVNELAMRPHNSGHWSIEGSVTSQFEQHIRAVLDLPLGDTSMTFPHVVMVNLIGSELTDPTDAFLPAMNYAPAAKIHLYGKEVRPNRKLGHVTMCGSNLEDARQKAYGAMCLLAGEPVAEAPQPPTSPRKASSK